MTGLRNFKYLWLGFEIYEKRNEARWREYELKKHSTEKKRFIKSLEEKINSLSSSVEAPPQRAEGYAKRHQKHGFQKYLDDAMGECNETIVGLEQCRDLYGENVDRKLCEQLLISP